MMSSKRSAAVGSSIWDRVISLSDQPSAVAARAFMKLQFPETDLQRMRELAAKARRGALTPAEEAEAEAYEQFGCLLDILHSRARRVLKQRRTAS
jgi:hypothetical protein